MTKKSNVECPHCREITQYYPVPLWVIIVGFLIIACVIGFIYLQYVMSKKEGDECNRLLSNHHMNNK
jgi:type VI protein secretion system component VasF